MQRSLNVSDQRNFSSVDGCRQTSPTHTNIDDIQANITSNVFTQTVVHTSHIKGRGNRVKVGARANLDVLIRPLRIGQYLGQCKNPAFYIYLTLFFSHK